MEPKEKSKVETWQPQRILREIQVRASSMGVTEVETDVGPGYAKLLGNPFSDESLGCELIATRVASWFGIQTFDFAVVPCEIEVIFSNGRTSKRGPALVTRKVVQAETFRNDTEQTDRIENRADVVRLVVVDTLVRNPDRCPPRPRWPNSAFKVENLDNVFLGSGVGKGALRLFAMDFSVAFSTTGELNAKCFGIDAEKDDSICGCFESFRKIVAASPEVVDEAAENLGRIDRNLAKSWIDDLPGEWLRPERAARVAEFLQNRAGYLSDRIKTLLPDNARDRETQRQLFANTPDPPKTPS